MSWSWSSPIMKPKEPIKAGDLVLDHTDNKIGLVIRVDEYDSTCVVYKEGGIAGLWTTAINLERMPAKTMLTIVQE